MFMFYVIIYYITNRGSVWLWLIKLISIYQIYKYNMNMNIMLNIYRSK